MSRKAEPSLLEEVSEFFWPSDPQPKDIKEWLLGRMVPCFLCKRDLDIRFSKKNRPYTVCTECQTQTFIRGNKGFQRLVTLVRKQEGQE